MEGFNAYRRKCKKGQLLHILKCKYICQIDAYVLLIKLFRYKNVTDYVV